MKNMSIRNKLLITILTVTVITITGLAGISFHISSETILEQNERYMAVTVEKSLDELKLWLNDRVREITLLSQDPLLLDFLNGENREKVYQRLMSYHRQSPVYEAIFLADSEGVVILNTNENKVIGLNLSQQPEYAENVAKARQNLIWVGNVGKSPASGRPVCLITAPILDKNQVRGILGMPVELNIFTDALISKHHFGETDYLAIADENGITLAHPDKTMILETDISEYEFGRKMLRQKNGRIAYEWEGRKKFAEFRTLRQKNWIIIDTIEKAELMRAVSLIKWISLVLGLAGVGLISLFTWLILKRSLVKPLDQVVTFVRKVSVGDLTETLDSGGRDELGQLLDSMNHMVVDLREVVSSVKSGSENVAIGSMELSRSSEQLSQGASEQAASAEQVSSSIEEMSANIRQNADNAFQTEKIALACAQDASEGGKAVMETVSAMRAIAEKISVIEEIARRTDLLALNAAVEAARAGDHGKGFAVVASEVRKLSIRTRKSAAEISKLSGSSMEIAEKAGQILNRIVPNIEKTAELVQEISAASNEQSAGTEQINEAIQQLDQVIQQNASASEEMASTSEEFSVQVEQLRKAMGYFVTSRQTGLAGDVQAVSPVREASPAWGKPAEEVYIEQNYILNGKEGDSGNGKKHSLDKKHMARDSQNNSFAEFEPY